jgi:hypothetical protein
VSSSSAASVLPDIWSEAARIMFSARAGLMRHPARMQRLWGPIRKG